MTTAYNNHKTSIPAFIRKVKEAEKLNLQIMTALLLVDVAFVIIAALAAIPFSLVFTVASALLVVIVFFGYRTNKYTRMLKKIETRIIQDIEFHRFTRSI